MLKRLIKMYAFDCLFHCRFSTCYRQSQQIYPTEHNKFCQPTQVYSMCSCVDFRRNSNKRIRLKHAVKRKLLCHSDSVRCNDNSTNIEDEIDKARRTDRRRAKGRANQIPLETHRCNCIEHVLEKFSFVLSISVLICLFILQNNGIQSNRSNLKT